MVAVAGGLVAVAMSIVGVAGPGVRVGFGVSVGKAGSGVLVAPGGTRVAVGARAACAAMSSGSNMA